MRKINSDTIANLDDEELDELIIDKGSEKHCGTFGEYFENNEKDEVLCEIYSVGVMEGDICNGGFDQFFLNFEDLIFPALNGLQKINAPKHHNLLKRAYEIYINQKDEFIDKRNINLDELDDEFYELDDLAPYRQKFIRENIDFFLD
ncbi:DUF4375 domain-containing protein [Arcicella sp. LKC2W]|uniref:DMP19 family protein n=1 Tax=Arcicella sp. LKC2W TaxID=2984198 RepID=UPI002B1F64A6|nr:DUF4375 domain-containing protein [Arcicella sp. LKC2W]MEA5458798.1 DUF4375 domain-containing protein [Arcicella sp. LKC2W]